MMSLFLVQIIIVPRLNAIHLAEHAHFAEGIQVAIDSGEIDFSSISPKVITSIVSLLHLLLKTSLIIGYGSGSVLGSIPIRLIAARPLESKT